MRFPFGCLLALCLAIPGTAATARTLVGGGFVHQFTQACQPDNNAIANRVDYPYVTYVIGEEAGRPSELIFAYRDGTINVQSASHFARGPSFVRGIGRDLSSIGFRRYQPRPAYRVRQRLVVQPLGAPLAQAEQIYMRVSIRNWWGIAGCNVEAVLTVGARPGAANPPTTEGAAAADRDEGGGARPPTP